MGLFSYEIVFGIKQKILLMFNLCSTFDNIRKSKLTQQSPCLLKHTYTDHLCHQPQIKKIQKGTLAHWFFNRQKTHSVVYNIDYNNFDETKRQRSFVNRRFDTTQPLNITSYVLIPNKAPQVGVSK